MLLKGLSEHILIQVLGLLYLRYQHVKFGYFSHSLIVAIPVFFSEADVVLLEDVIVHVVEINSVSDILELLLDFVKRVTLLDIFLYRGC